MPEVSTQWVAVLRPARAGTFGRVVVLPHSGAGPNALLPLLQRLPDTLEVAGVTLPGRERRFGEPPETLLEEPGRAVAAVVAELRALPPLPTVLFGHSMGAALAAAVAIDAPELCQGLVLSAHPTLKSRAGRGGPWSDGDLLDVLRLGGGDTPAELLADDIIRGHLIARLRCDLTLGRHLAERNEGSVLPVVPSVLGGQDDELVPPRDLDRWSGHPGDDSAVRLYPGGHFYLLDEANLDAVAEEIVRPFGAAGRLALSAATDASPAAARRRPTYLASTPPSPPRRRD
ncbi:thioesterase II family protein [Streptomyces sp. NPDC003233]